MPEKNLYDLLGVREDAPEEIIHKAYLQAIQNNHPDHQSDSRHASELVRKINRAKYILLNTDRREEYDQQLRAKRLRAAGQPPLQPPQVQSSEPASVNAHKLEPSPPSAFDPFADDFSFDRNTSRSYVRTSRIKRRRKKTNPVIAFLGVCMGGLGGICIAIVLLWVIFGQDPLQIRGTIPAARQISPQRSKEPPRKQGNPSPEPKTSSPDQQKHFAPDRERFEYQRRPPTVENSIGMLFEKIQPGSFQMGSKRNARSVTTPSSFFLGKYEVTREQYALLMGSGTSFSSGADYPIANVTWNDAVEFCRMLSSLPAEISAGYAYRLPTEEEWEYACRAQSNTKYSFGNESELLTNYGWYSANSDKRSNRVGLKEPNRWGLYDMHGNVSEWCQTDPRVTSKRPARGGGWLHTPEGCSSAARMLTPDRKLPYVGFRIVRISAGTQPSFSRQ